MSHPFIKNGLAVILVANNLSAILILIFHKRITSIRNYKIFWHDLRNKKVLTASLDWLALGTTPRSILLWSYMATGSAADFWYLTTMTDCPVATPLALPEAGVFIKFIWRCVREHNLISFLNKSLGFLLVELDSLAIDLIRIFIDTEKVTPVDLSQMHSNLALSPVDRL